MQVMSNKYFCYFLDVLRWEVDLNISDMAGDFWYNLTAENLHSDPDYGVVGEVSGGGCLIHVQHPINFFNTTPSKPYHIIGITEPNNGTTRLKKEKIINVISKRYHFTRLFGNNQLQN